MTEFDERLTAHHERRGIANGEQGHAHRSPSANDCDEPSGCTCDHGTSACRRHPALATIPSPAALGAGMPRQAIDAAARIDRLETENRLLREGRVAEVLTAPRVVDALAAFLDGVPSDSAAWTRETTRARALRILRVVEEAAAPADLERADAKVDLSIDPGVGDTASAIVPSVLPAVPDGGQTADTGEVLLRERFRRVIDRLSVEVGELAPRTDRVERIAQAVRDGMRLLYPVEVDDTAMVEIAARKIAKTWDWSCFEDFDGDPNTDDADGFEDRIACREAARAVILTIPPAAPVEGDGRDARERDDELLKLARQVDAGALEAGATPIDTVAYGIAELLGGRAQLDLDAELLRSLGFTRASRPSNHAGQLVVGWVPSSPSGESEREASALRRYGRHEGGCKASGLTSFDDECTCGFSAAYVAAAPSSLSSGEQGTEADAVPQIVIDALETYASERNYRAQVRLNPRLARKALTALRYCGACNIDSDGTPLYPNGEGAPDCPSCRGTGWRTPPAASSGEQEARELARRFLLGDGEAEHLTIAQHDDDPPRATPTYLINLNMGWQDTIVAERMYLDVARGVAHALAAVLGCCVTELSESAPAETLWRPAESEHHDHITAESGIASAPAETEGSGDAE